MKLCTWNVNGIRSAQTKGFLDWLQRDKPDVVGLQETKASEDQLDFFLRHPEGYETIWYSGEKAGYSGVAILTRVPPIELKFGLGEPSIDREGRVLTAEYKDFTFVTAYFPNSQPDHGRLPFKLHFANTMKTYLDSIVAKGKPVVLCGDYNIAHEEIDLANPKSNRETAGFLPAEREWMGTFLRSGYTDIFRKQHPGEPNHYTWWSYRPGVRQRNIGWRIDLHCVNNDFADRVARSWIQPEQHGSDHCPSWIELRG